MIRAPRQMARQERQDSPPRHLLAAQSVHDHGAVCRVLFDRAGDGRALSSSRRSRFLLRSCSTASTGGLRDSRIPRVHSAPNTTALSDMVSFGVAPALVIYHWALQDFTASRETSRCSDHGSRAKLGWIAAFIYCACAALRLARFNTQLDVVDKRFFQGLPSPAAASLVAGLVWAIEQHRLHGPDVQWLAWVITMFAGSVHGQQFPVLQRQRHQPAQKRVLLGRRWNCAGARVLGGLSRARCRKYCSSLFGGYGLSGYVMSTLGFFGQAIEDPAAARRHSCKRALCCKAAENPFILVRHGTPPSGCRSTSSASALLAGLLLRVRAR